MKYTFIIYQFGDISMNKFTIILIMFKQLNTSAGCSRHVSTRREATPTSPGKSAIWMARPAPRCDWICTCHSRQAYRTFPLQQILLLSSLCTHIANVQCRDEWGYSDRAKHICMRRYYVKIILLVA